MYELVLHSGKTSTFTFVFVQKLLFNEINLRTTGKAHSLLRLLSTADWFVIARLKIDPAMTFIDKSLVEEGEGLTTSMGRNCPMWTARRVQP